MKTCPTTESGSTFVISLLMLMVLSMIGSAVLMTVSTRYNYTQKAIGWDEALDGSGTRVVRDPPKCKTAPGRGAEGRLGLAA